MVDLSTGHGRRERITFPTRAEADAFALQARIAKQNEGAAAFSLPTDIRVEAAKCIQLLEPYDATLSEATDYYIDHVLVFKAAPSLSDIVERMLAELRTAGRRKVTVRSLRYCLEKLADQHGKKRITDLTTQDLKAFCLDPSVAVRTRRNRVRMVSQLYHYCMKHGWAESDLTAKLVLPAKESKEPGILTVDQAAQLLAKAPDFDLLPYMAIGLFAGVRAKELMNLNWDAVNLDDREIVIGADIAKTRSRRVIQYGDTLASWLEACGDRIGPLVDTEAFRKNFDALKTKAGMVRWPHNGLRHSFASFHLAKFQDEVRTSHLLGHRGGTEMLHSHYKGLVSTKEAERFWSLTPEVVRRGFLGCKNGADETVT